jgi:hypothetical protein
MALSGVGKGAVVMDLGAGEIPCKEFAKLLQEFSRACGEGAA